MVSQWEWIAAISSNSVLFGVRWTNDRRAKVTRTRWGRNRVPCSCCSACCCRDWCAPSHPAKVSQDPPLVSLSLSLSRVKIRCFAGETATLRARISIDPRTRTRQSWRRVPLRASSFAERNECSLLGRWFDKLGNGPTRSEKQPSFYYFCSFDGRN